MVSLVPSDGVLEFRGLSSDVKPIGSNCSNANSKYLIANGSSFLEMDTSKVFMLKIDGNVGTWVEL